MVDQLGECGINVSAVSRKLPAAKVGLVVIRMQRACCAVMDSHLGIACNMTGKAGILLWKRLQHHLT